MVETMRDRTILVTGGLSGIGEAICARLLGDGARVVAADLSAETDTLSTDQLSPFRLDVSDPGSVNACVDAIISRHGRLDGVVNSAGIGIELPFLDTPVDVFDRIVAINLRGTFLVGQSAARAMRQSQGGSIVNIGSVSGLLGNAARAAYGASKGGVDTLSKVMAVDLAQFGIRVNVVAPGPVATPMVEKGHSAQTRTQFEDRTPLRRYGRPSEIAEAVLFLLSDASSYITGQIIAVDGGFSSQGLAAVREVV
ncbi:MAG: NAD(P)-dependent oxidoreductase [Sphingomonadales bacterium]|nr:NAD(P)-dependent oxidoreductase [Sphingomonadales bacterium]